jgi:serine/threonine-protein kinase
MRPERADFVKVLDFGIAKVMHESGINDGAELTVMGQTVGTLEYMAPEQLMGGKCDGRTDIYTLGVVAYEMITGRRPFGAVGLDLLTVQLSETPVPASQLADVPARADRILLRCLDHDAERRFADVHELARAIDEVLAAEPTRAPMPAAVAAAPPALRISPAPAPIPRFPTPFPALVPRAPRLRVGRIAIAVALLVALGAGIAVVIEHL